MFGFAHTKHGFVAIIFGKEISYAHFPEHIGISWRRSLVIGKRRWYFRENFRLFARSVEGKFFRFYNGR